MRRWDLTRKKLFVCTKPYQYLICRLIKEGYNYNKCDLLVLYHFEGAERFVERVKKLDVWKQVFFEDDTILNLGGCLDMHRFEIGAYKGSGEADSLRSANHTSQSMKKCLDFRGSLQKIIGGNPNPNQENTR